MIRGFSLVPSLLAATIAITISLPATADLVVIQIHSHKECPEGLTVTARSANGMIDLIVRADANKIEQGDSYEGRIKATCHLDLSLNQKRIAYSELQGTPEKNDIVFRMTISANAAMTSHFDLNTHLYDANGLPTIGGGKTFRICLAEFLPTKQESDDK